MTCEHGYIGACSEGCDVPQGRDVPSEIEELDLYDDIKVIESLVIQSLDRVRSRDLRAALWRLVDAAGLISRVVDTHGLQPTGRGFSVINTMDKDRSIRVKESEEE